MGAIGMRCEAAATARVSEASRKGATVGDEATVSETPDEAARARLLAVTWWFLPPA